MNQHIRFTSTHPRYIGRRCDTLIDSNAQTGLSWRRLLFFGLVGLSSAGASGLMANVLWANGITTIEAAILGLFTINFSWVALSFWTAAIGFAIHMTADRMAKRGSAYPTVPANHAGSRTAVVMPVYNEDTKRVFAGLEVIYRSLQGTGRIDEFDLFILSDSTDKAIAAREESAWSDLCQRVGGWKRIFYRRRAENIERKAGNISDFCRRWGGGYEAMVVMDADSIMSGEAIVRLADLMQRHPEVGIIQTLPMPVNRETLFARIIQFANRLYGPILASGLGFWHRGDSNYWGHNAIIRMSAFVDNCGLPRLPGREPLGGEILSHDFVEAALIRRAGWSVWLLPEVGGSYEEVPPNILEFAKRDRRWSQGNLQHLKILFARRFHWVSRLHLLMGVMSYVSSPLWLILLLLCTADFLHQALVAHAYFPPGFNLFPVWPIAKTAEAVTLFGVTIAMLVLPKLLALTATLSRPAERESFGGARALLASAFLEQLFSMLTAPAMMLFHSRFVASILLGIGVGWGPQTRDDRGVTLPEALASQGSHMLIGAVWGGLVLALAPQFFWWLLPVVFGMVFAVPLTVLSSRISAGRAATRFGLFLTPDEIDPPRELRNLRTAMAERADPVDEAAALARTARLHYGPEIMVARNAFRVQRPAPVRPATASVSWRPSVTYPEHRPCEMVPQRFEYPSFRVVMRAS